MATNPQLLVRRPQLLVRRPQLLVRRPRRGYSVAPLPGPLSSRYRPLPSINPLLRNLRIFLPPPRTAHGLLDYLNTGLIRYVCILYPDTALLTSDLYLRGFLYTFPLLFSLELLLPNLSDRIYRPDRSLNYN